MTWDSVIKEEIRICAGVHGKFILLIIVAKIIYDNYFIYYYYYLLFFFLSGKSMSPWRDAECLDTLGFHLCNGKLMSCQGLLNHLQTKKSSCYFHLGILHVLQNLYGNGKKCPPIASRLVRSKRDLEYMSVRGSLHVRDEALDESRLVRSKRDLEYMSLRGFLHVRDEALDESMSQKISSNHVETEVTEEELQYLVPETIPTKFQLQAYNEVETSDVLEGISTSHYLEMVSLIPDCLSLGDKTVDNDKTAHTAHPLVSDVDNIKCNEVIRSQTLSSPSVTLDEFESEAKKNNEVMDTYVPKYLILIQSDITFQGSSIHPCIPNSVAQVSTKQASSDTLPQSFLLLLSSHEEAIPTPPDPLLAPLSYTSYHPQNMQLFQPDHDPIPKMPHHSQAFLRRLDMTKHRWNGATRSKSTFERCPPRWKWHIYDLVPLPTRWLLPFLQCPHSLYVAI